VRDAFATGNTESNAAETVVREIPEFFSCPGGRELLALSGSAIGHALIGGDGRAEASIPFRERLRRRGGSLSTRCAADGAQKGGCEVAPVAGTVAA
jgi:hypothetical protein